MAALPPARAVLLASPLPLLLLAMTPALGQDRAAAAVTYADDLLPIIQESCARCHGERRQRGGLRLDGLGHLVAGSDFGPVLVPGDPEASALVQVLLLPIEHERHMPPDGKPQPTAEQIALFRTWVRDGAEAEVADLAPVARALPPLGLEFPADPAALAFGTHVAPVLERYCFACHTGEDAEAGLRLDELDPDLVQGGDGDAWRHALDMVNGGVMPPRRSPQPEDAERRALVGWLTESLRRASIADEGARTSVLRRLNRAQYTATLQDLLGLSIDFGRKLPPDGRSRMGFSNNGEVLQASPLHLESYQAIAREALEQAIVVGERPAPAWYRVTFGKGLGVGQVGGETGGYQSVPLSSDDFTVELLDADGVPRRAADDDERAALEEVQRRISVGLRGSSHSRFRVVEDGLILYGARPHVEKVPKAWQGPSPNVKLEMQRVFPERGDFELRVRASRGHLVSSRELLLIDLEEPRPQAALVVAEAGASTDGTQEPAGPQGGGDAAAAGPSASPPLELTTAPGALHLTAAASDEHTNLEALGDALVPVERTAEASARLRLQLEEPGFFQIDLVHPALPADAMPSVRLSLGRVTLDRRIQPEGEEAPGEGETHRDRAVTALGAAYLPSGTHTLKVGGPFFVGFTDVVLTPLAPDHPAVLPFTQRTEELAAEVARRTPSLRAFVGTRTDDGMDYGTFGPPQEVLAPLGAPETYVFRGRLENLPIPEPDSGDTEILSGFLLVGVWNDHLVKSPEDPGPPILVHAMEFEAPVFDAWPPASHRRIFFASPNQGDREISTREVLAAFLDRAFRRPVGAEELERYMDFWRRVRDEAPSWEEGVREVLVAALCSPHFLYLVEPDPGEATVLDDHALASRLSYFLWNSPPDDTLRGLAARGELADALVPQVHRMLRDERTRRFVDTFADEWLRLDRHRGMTVDPNRYPTYTRFVKRDMAQETRAFLHEVLASDRSIFELIDSDFAMLNQNLAEYYGLQDVVAVEGNTLRPVPLPRDLGRGGLLSQGAFLAGHSDGQEAHPIKRAVWLKERILGDPPPPPPPNVPDLDPSDPDLQGLSLKEQLELHRENPSCHDCHLGIDPYGLVFEGYDAGGRLQELRDGAPVDTSTTLPDGTEVRGVAGMKSYIVERVPDDFARSLIEHLFAYALGRDVRYGDAEEVEAILEHVRSNDYRMRSVLEGIVMSPSFTRP